MADGSFIPIEKPRRVVDKNVLAAIDRGYCEHCGRYFDPQQNQVHAAHFRSRGAGGDDSVTNVFALCWECHGRQHNGSLSLADLLAVVLWRRGADVGA